MVSWSRAFGAAGLYVAFLIIWTLVGGILIFAGIFTTARALLWLHMIHIQDFPGSTQQELELD